MAEDKKTTEVAERQEMAPVVAGQEQIDDRDRDIPYVNIAHFGSDAVEQLGADPGDFVCESLGIITKELNLVLVHREMTIVERTVEEDGLGDFVKRYAVADEEIKPFTGGGRFNGKVIRPDNGNSLEEEARIYGIMLDEDGETPIAPFGLTLSSTRLAAWRSLNTLLTMHDRQGIDTFRNRLTMGTRLKTKGKNKWFIPTFRALGGNLKNALLEDDSDLAQMGRDLAIAVLERRVEADESTHETGGDEAAAAAHSTKADAATDKF